MVLALPSCLSAVSGLSTFFKANILSGLNSSTPCFHSSLLISVLTYFFVYSEKSRLVSLSTSNVLSIIFPAYFFQISITCGGLVLSFSRQVTNTLCLVCETSVCIVGPPLPPIRIYLYITGILPMKSTSLNLVGTENPTIGFFWGMKFLGVALVFSSVTGMISSFSLG